MVMVLASFAIACDARDAGESSGTDCADGADDDGDGLRDCADPGCAAHAWCGGGGDAGPGVDSGIRADAGPPRDGGPPVSVCDDPIDVVFAIDVSTSMADEIASIRTGIDSIFAATAALTANHRFGLVVFVDDVVAVESCASFPDAGSLQAELMRWQTFTSSNDQPAGGASGNTDCAENSLDAIHTAATTCPWRPGALRILIHVTDDTFEEHPAVLSGDVLGGGIEVQHTYAETVSALVAAQVRVGAFAAPGAGEECGAGSSSDVGRGFHEPFMGMPALPMATGGRAWSIRDVRAGTLDMATAINEFTADEHCTLF